MTMDTINKLIATDDALSLLTRLKAQYGPLVILMSGAIEDGSLPMCYQQHELYLSADNIYVGTIGDTPFFMTLEQLAYWKNAEIQIDIANAPPHMHHANENCSVFFHEGIQHCFLTCTQLCDEEESLLLEKLFLPGRK